MKFFIFTEPYIIIATVYDSLIPASYRTDSLKCYILKSNR